MGLQQRTRVVTHTDRQVEGSGDTVGRDVVMRRSDPATGDDVVITVRQRPDRRNDGIAIVADHAHFLQVDAPLGQLARQMVHIRIPRPPRQDFVTDHKHGGGGIGHRRFS